MSAELSPALQEALVRAGLHPTGRALDPNPERSCGSCAGLRTERGGRCDTRVAFYGEREEPRIASAFWPGCERWRALGTPRRRDDPYL